MRIADVHPIFLRMPFEIGGTPLGVSDQDSRFLDFVLVPMEMKDGPGLGIELRLDVIKDYRVID